MMARLAPDDRRVLCDRDNCGSVLGLRHHTDHGWLLALRPGFRREAGDVFRMTPTALARLRAGRAPRRVGRSSKWMGDGTEQWPQPCCLPVEVRCPKCSLVQHLDPQALRVEMLPHGGPHHVDSEWGFDVGELADVLPVRPRANQRRRSRPQVL